MYYIYYIYIYIYVLYIYIYIYVYVCVYFFKVYFFTSALSEIFQFFIDRFCNESLGYAAYRTESN